MEPVGKRKTKGSSSFFLNVKNEDPFVFLKNVAFFLFSHLAPPAMLPIEFQGSPARKPALSDVHPYP
jgi:hypothetical protein